MLYYKFASILRNFKSNPYYKLNYNLMNFSKFWKASALLAAFVVPFSAYSLKSKEGDVWVWGSGRNGELGLGQ